MGSSLFTTIGKYIHKRFQQILNKSMKQKLAVNTFIFKRFLINNVLHKLKLLLITYPEHASIPSVHQNYQLHNDLFYCRRYDLFEGKSLSRCWDIHMNIFSALLEKCNKVWNFNNPSSNANFDIAQANYSTLINKWNLRNYLFIMLQIKYLLMEICRK